MKLHTNPQSAFVTVEFEPQDVEAFASRWPCFSGPESVSFTFQRSSGDLVDMEPSEFDGSEALAMSEDAWAYYEEHQEPEPPATFREWLTGTLDAEQIEDLARHGADTGWPGITYTSECVELFDRYSDEIREALNEDAEAFGYESPEAFVATFNRRDMLWSEDGRKNLLVWYMSERVAHDVVEGVER